MTQPPDRGTDEFERAQLVLEDARERARRIIDQSVAEAQQLLTRRPAADDGGVHRALATLTDEMRDLRQRLDRIESLLRRQEQYVAERASAPVPAPAPPSEAPEPVRPAPPPVPPPSMPLSPPQPEQPAPTPPAPAPPSPPPPAAAQEPPSPPPAPVPPEPAPYRLMPDGGPVTVLVSPVAGFQGLMRVQEALVHIDAVSEAIVEGYAQGEARLRLQLREPIALSTLGSGLSAALAQQADVQPSADDVRTLRVALS